MAATISDLANGADATAGAAVVTGATVTASVGDWLVVLVACTNAGGSGAACTLSCADSDGTNTYTERAKINFTPTSSNNDGATLGIFTTGVTSALSSDTVTVSFSPNTTQAALQVYKVAPGAGETVSFIAADTTGSTGNTSTYSAATVSVTNGDIIFGGASIETDDAITGDSDTTNGDWSSIITRLADAGADAVCMACSSQYKTVNATGDQDWACTSSTARDSARSYLVIRSAVAASTTSPGPQGPGEGFVGWHDGTIDPTMHKIGHGIACNDDQRRIAA